MKDKLSMHDIGYCWIGGARYSNPLDPAAEKKWRLLSELGIKVSVIGFSGNLRPRRFDQYASFYLLPHLPGSALRYITMILLSPLLLFWAIVTHKTRVLISQSPYEGAIAAIVKIIARLCGVRIILIVESHGDFENDLFMYRQIALVRLYRWLMGLAARFAFQNADLLRVISVSTRAQVEALANDKPIEQFATWTDIDLFLGTARRTPLPEASEILYVGVLIPRKGIHVLVDAFADICDQITNATVRIIGAPLNLAYADELHRQVDRLGIDDKIIFMGELPQAALADYYASSRVFILPSLSEGLGRVVIEAMACGTPAIGSRVGGIPDLIEQGQTGYLVEPGNKEELVQAILQAFTDANIERMGVRAREAAQKRFSTTVYIDSYQRLFDKAYQLWSAL